MLPASLLGVYRVIRADERRDVGAAFLFLFGLVGSHSVLETARDALFLADLPAERLPLVYLGIAAATLVATQVQSRLGRHLSRRRNVATWTATAAVVTALLYGALLVGGQPVLYVLYVWTGLVTTLVLVHFWTLLGDLFSVTQAKRVYGAIGAGSVLGAIVGSATAAALAAALPAPTLLLVAAAGFGLTALSSLRLGHAGPVTTAPASDDDEDDPKEGLRTQFVWIAKHPYARWVALVVVLGTAALTMGDYLFKSVAARQIPADELGQFFGSVYVVLNVLSLVAQLGLVSYLLRRFDLSLALSILPVLLVAGSIGVLATGTLFAAMAVKAADGALKHSLHRTSVELMFVPLSARARARTKAFVDVLGQRGGQALASLGILGLAALGAVESGAAIALGVLSLAWLVAAVKLRQPYLSLFRNRLRLGWTYEGRFPDLDVSSLESLVAALDSEDEHEVVAALDLLEQEGRSRVVPGFILYHPSELVVERALTLFSSTGRRSVLHVVDRLMESESDAVRAAAIAARTALDPNPQQLRLRLSFEESPEVRSAIMVHLIVSREIQGQDAEDALQNIIEHGSVASRVGLAQAIGQRRQAAPTSDDLVTDPVPSVVQRTVDGLEARLMELVTHTEREVQMAAIEAMGQIQAPAFIPHIVRQLGVERLRATARRALIGYGDPAVATLMAALQDASQPPMVRWEIPATLCRIGDPEEIGAFLLSRLPAEREGLVRYRIIAALETVVRRLPDLDLDSEPLDRAIQGAVERAYRYLDRRLVLKRGAEEVPSRATPGHALLAQSLRDKERNTVDRVFRLLALRYPDAGFREIQLSLASRNTQTRAAGLELVENLLKPPLRGAVMGLIDDQPDEDRRRAGAVFHRPLGLDYIGLLHHMLDSSSEAVQAMTAFHVGELADEGFVDKLTSIVEATGLDDAQRALHMIRPEVPVAG